MENRQRPVRSMNCSPAPSTTNFSGAVSSNVTNERFDYLFKVVLVGDTGVGKSSLLNRFADDTFTERMTATIGVDFKIRTLQIEGKRVKLQIWDSAGQERFRALTASYYRGAHAVAIVFDLTCIDSLNALQNIWLDEIDRHCPSSTCRVVIGNKNDLVKNREIPPDQVRVMMHNLGCLYLETSAKTADNVQNAFESIVRKIIQSDDFAQPIPITPSVCDTRDNDLGQVTRGVYMTESDIQPSDVVRISDMIPGETSSGTKSKCC